MNTFLHFLPGVTGVPLVTAWELAEIAERKGRQDLYARQSPRRLRRMRECAVIESAVSSNRIEGVRIEEKRVGTVLFGGAPPSDRDEEEVRGYREALDWIHTAPGKIPLTAGTIRRLHALCRPGVWDAGRFKEKPGDIIELYPDGSRRVRFRTVEPEKAGVFLDGALERYAETAAAGRFSPLIALAAFNLDFLCIHPFRDGNGRVSRLLLQLMLYQLGYEAGRYVSIEKAIEDSKARYYETLEISSKRWHEGRHDAWPYINYLLSTLRAVYEKFERKFEDTRGPRGEKTAWIIRVLNELDGEFSLKEIERRCPGISRDMIQTVMRRNGGHLQCSGHGAGSRWRRIGVIPSHEGNNRGNER